MINFAEQPNLINLLLEARDLDWNPNIPTPQGLTVQNMRGRGIDEYRIFLTAIEQKATTGLLSGLKMFSKQIAQITSIVVCEHHIKIGSSNAGQTTGEETTVAIKDISMVAVRPASATFRASLQVSVCGATPDVPATKFDMGAGLPLPTLQWLRDRLILEVSGLVSRPLYNVGRRTTRRTFNPDDEQYMCWPTGPNRLIDMFIAGAPNRSVKFQAACLAQDWTGAASHIQWLRAAGAAVGAGQLSELCQRLEIEIEGKDPTQLGKLNVYYQAEFQRVSECLDCIRRGEPPPKFSKSTTEAAAALFEGRRPFEGLKILLVEDSLVNQELARDTLENEGFVVTSARSGEAAITEFAKGSFDLILMDCQMPGMGGLEATRIIRNNELNSFRPKIPIIALTAHTLRDDRNRCLAVGMNDYLGKPYTTEELMEMLLKWLPEVPAAEQAAG